MTQIIEPLTTAEREGTVPVSVERYHQLGETGLLGPEDRVELLENRIVPRMSKNPPHTVAKQKLAKCFISLLPAQWYYRAEDPITLADGEPEPDGAVVRGDIDDYLARHPIPNEITLVIEAADSSLSQDRGVKLRSYARAGIATYWIVNIIDRVIEVYTDPRPDMPAAVYGTRQDYDEADAVPIVLDGQVVGTILGRDILP